jgi:hypothetical protein
VFRPNHTIESGVFFDSRPPRLGLRRRHRFPMASIEQHLQLTRPKRRELRRGETAGIAAMARRAIHQRIVG